MLNRLRKEIKHKNHQAFVLWRRGAGTLVLGVFFMVVLFFFTLMFIEIYQQRENYIETKAATDTIADGTALYAKDNYDATYSDIVNRANAISSVVKDEVGIDVGNIDVSKDDFNDEDTVTASVDPSFHYITNSFGTAYDIATVSGTEFSKYEYVDGGYLITGSGTGVDVIKYALQFVGNPYVWGGTSLTNGCDCSGFVMMVYAHFGVSLPHYSGSQRNCGMGVSLEDAKAGDIICYNGHVGLYIGDGMMVNASNSKPYPAGGIKVQSIMSSHGGNVVAVRRIFSD